MKQLLLAGLLILAIQCVLVAAVYWPQAVNPPAEALQAFASFDRASIDEIFVGDEYDNETLLKKVGDRWLLPELEDLPADAAMIDKLLDALTGDETQWPVADSVAARQRFQVAPYYYQRRIRLLGGDELQGTFLLGKSPGFRKVHVRNAEQDAIYVISFNTYDAPGHGGAWLDRKLLQIRTPLRITADSYSLSWQEGEWRSGLGHRPEERELEALLSALRSLQIDGIANGDRQRDLAEAEAELVLQVESLGGTVSLELFEMGEQHFIYSSEYPLFFTVSAYDYERLTGIDFRLISGEANDGQ
jgi:hypothetical protein